MNEDDEGDRPEIDEAPVEFRLSGSGLPALLVAESGPPANQGIDRMSLTEACRGDIVGCGCADDDESDDESESDEFFAPPLRRLA